MKRNIFRTCVLGLGLLTLASCDDPMDELTSIFYDRVFSPIDFEARNIKETSVDLQWVASAGAKGYTVEIFADDSLEFAGEPTRTINGITTTSITVSDLVYDTKYSARVMAHDSTDVDRDSKWTEVYFRTSAQQIFDNIPETDISDTYVTMTWPAGEAVTRITATNTVTGEVVVIKELTQDEIAAGKAVVTGLQPETAYRVNLYNGNETDGFKERGSKTFTTIASLEGTIQVHEGDDLSAAIANAPADAVITLFPGTYYITDEDEPGKGGCATVNKNLTIKGVYPTSVPTIKGRFQIEDGASLSISQAVLDGSENATTDQAFNYKTAGVVHNVLDIQNCEIKNFTKGLLYLNVAAVINRVTFNNCLIHDIECNGGDFYDCRTGLVVETNFTNSTIYHCAWERDFFRMDDPSTKPASGYPTLNVTNCTLNDVSNASGKRLMYIRYAGNVINWSNNITSNTVAVFTNQSKTNPAVFTNNVYFNTPNLSSVVEKTNLFTDESAISWDVDPAYTDAANGNFTVTNEDISSRLVGDPRWYTAQ